MKTSSANRTLDRRHASSMTYVKPMYLCVKNSSSTPTMSDTTNGRMGEQTSGRHDEPRRSESFPVVIPAYAGIQFCSKNHTGAGALTYFYTNARLHYLKHIGT